MVMLLLLDVSGSVECDECVGLLAEEEGRLNADPRAGLDLAFEAETGTV